MTKDTRSNYLSGAEALVKLLDQHEVNYIFGLCGDTSLPFYDALYRLNHSIKHILTRDERSASYMADGYARVTGKVGVCEGPSGGGATYIIPGVVEANESSISVISITSDVPTTSIGHFPLTELNQKELFKPLTKWNEILNNPKKLGENIRKAFKMSTSGRPGACHLSFPFDVQTAEISDEDIWVNKKYCKFPSDPIKPDPKKIDLIAKEISKAKNPIIICGGAIKNSFAETEIKKLVEKLNIVLATSVTGKGTLEDSHPNCLGVVGSNGGSLYTREVLQKSDLIIFIGCRAGSVTTEKWQYPSSKSKIIHIDIDPRVIGANYKTHISLVADAKKSLIELNKKIKKNNFNGDKIIKITKKKKFSEFNKLCKEEKGLIKPERIVKEINNVMPDNTYIVVDPGTPCPYFSAYYNFKKSGRYFVTNRAHGALGYALPASIGVQIGRPKNKVVSVMGDGSFGFAVGELETAKRLSLPIIFIVISNSVYGWIKAGQKSSFNKRYYSVDFSRTDHARVAASYGIKTWTVKKPNELKKIISEAIKYKRGPCLIDIISQPLEEAKAPVSEWIA
ncbi:MAG TPA: thiamine pyrophosphate-binding protein [Candidatus Pelagibacter bacterium]|jgi:acetolactate synthase-1/2/3 large subunit|nr:thiamine pyrophosphate-binding protein [Candidatus Pelagibacter bacterium]